MECVASECHLLISQGWVIELLPWSGIWCTNNWKMMPQWLHGDWQGLHVKIDYLYSYTLGRTVEVQISDTGGLQVTRNSPVYHATASPNTLPGESKTRNYRVIVVCHSHSPIMLKILQVIGKQLRGANRVWTSFLNWPRLSRLLSPVLCVLGSLGSFWETRNARTWAALQKLFQLIA
jgi:hypothetical protein